METKQILSEMVGYTVDAFEQFYESNRKLDQLYSAKMRIGDMVDNLGDVGMAYVYKKISVLQRDEKLFNDKITHTYYAYERMVKHMLNYVDDPEYNIEWYENCIDQRREEANRRWKNEEVETKKGI